jgi:hemin uptake protein HemP
MALKIDTPKPNWSIPVTDRKIESAAIFQGSNELCILHNGFEYKLRLTGNDKLILTK